MTFCRTCSKSPCSGALSLSSRNNCINYSKWINLKPDQQSLLFMKAASEEIVFLEDLIND